jgi:hypothetical protein
MWKRGLNPDANAPKWTQTPDQIFSGELVSAVSALLDSQNIETGESEARIKCGLRCLAVLEEM